MRVGIKWAFVVALVVGVIVFSAMGLGFSEALAASVSVIAACLLASIAEVRRRVWVHLYEAFRNGSPEATVTLGLAATLLGCLGAIAASPAFGLFGTVFIVLPLAFVGAWARGFFDKAAPGTAAALGKAFGLLLLIAPWLALGIGIGRAGPAMAWDWSAMSEWESVRDIAQASIVPLAVLAAPLLLGWGLGAPLPGDAAARDAKMALPADVTEKRFTP
jgi:hypothetical protein